MRTRTPFPSLLILALMLVGTTQAARGQIRYVKSGGTGDGSTWSSAAGSLEGAMDSLGGEPGEVWVAAGTYTPTVQVGGTGDRYRCFQLRNGVALYGGFTGAESQRYERDWEANPTILSGDLQGDDNDNVDSGEATRQDNSYHVFYHPADAALDATAVLDGFTITGGNANGTLPFSAGGGMFNESSSPSVANCLFTANCASTGDSNGYGGGMYNRSADPTVSNCRFQNNHAYRGGGISNHFQAAPLITDCTFTANTGRFGGGVCDAVASPTIRNCRFQDNAADRYGGGIFSESDSSSTRIEYCTFVGNDANISGGGVGNWHSPPVLISCVFTGNTAQLHGGGIWNYGGNVTVTNCLFTGNDAGSTGGGICDAYNTLNMEQSSAVVTHCTLVGNSAGSSGGGVYATIDSTNQGALVYANCVFWDNTAPSAPLWDGSPLSGTSFCADGLEPTVTYCCIEGYTTGGFSSPGNIGTDPQFAFPSDGDFRLRAGSPCIDAGGATYAAAADLNGATRDAAPDMGAYEFPANCGDIAITLLPSAAIAAGGRWRVGTEDWHRSEAASDPLAPGDYTVEFLDLAGWLSPASLNVTVNARQTTVGSGLYRHTPVAGEDSYAILPDTVLTIPSPGVLGNDTDGDGEALVALLVSETLNGTIALETDGSFTYTPNQNFHGIDTFTYQASDGTLLSTATTVTISVRDIWYVNQNVRGSGDGRSWTSAFTNLEDALGVLSPGDEVWIAAGVYKPVFTNGISPGFTLAVPATLYGGFPPGAVDGTAMADRDPYAHPTVLSGDRFGDDALDALTGLPTPDSMVDNAARVLDVAGLADGSTVIDGLVIEGGNADNDPGADATSQCGGGIRAVSGTGGYRATPRLVIRNCQIRVNRAGNGTNYGGGNGGGVYVEGIDLLVEDGLFFANAAGDGPDGNDGTGSNWADWGYQGGGGGGMAVVSASNVTISHVRFEGNYAGKGGKGGKGGSSETDYAGGGGTGGMGGAGGGLYLQSVGTAATIQDCCFLENHAGNGGDGGDGGDSGVAEYGYVGNGGDGGGYGLYNVYYSGCGGALAATSYDSVPIAIRGSTFAKNAGGEGGKGGMAGNYTGIGTGTDGLPGATGIGGAGGGIFTSGSTLELANVTITDNKAAGSGGGIAVAVMYAGGMTARHLTLTNNRADDLGGGLAFDAQQTQSADTVSIVNSIVWGNSSLGTGTRSTGSDVWSPWGGITIANSIADASTSVGVSPSCQNLDPKLKTLSWNGGPTPTRAPDPGSPIIDNATLVAANESPATDQRGFPRDGTPDAGAFELRDQARDLAVTTISPTGATFSWTSGAWGYSVVFVRLDDPGDPKPRPEDGWVYNADPAFGSGGYITRTAWSCVYAGTGNTVTVTGLAPATKYTIMVCDTLTPDFVHNTEDALGNPLVFQTTIGPATLLSPAHCPDEPPDGPDGDSAASGHSLIDEPVFVWAPPAGTAGGDFEVWLDDLKIGDTAINPIGFRCFNGTTWSAFPETGGMPVGTVQLAFERDTGAQIKGRALTTTARTWWIVSAVADPRVISQSGHNRFLVQSVSWEDGTAIAGTTFIRAAQMTQLREEVNALLRMRVLGDADFLDPELTENSTPVRAEHFQQLRDAIRNAAAATGEDTSAWEWTDPVLTPNTTAIKAVHLEELRRALEGTYPRPVAVGR